MIVDYRVIWITGGSGGIGAALAIELSQFGCQLILSSRNEERLLQTKLRCLGDPRDVAIVPFDMEEVDNAVDVYNIAKQCFGRIDILINNAGISQRSLTTETDLDVYSKIMNINYLGTIALTKSVLPEMIERKSGQIVTITSLVGKFGTPLRSGYAASKHALHGFFDSLRSEVYSEGVEVLLVCPGFIQTDISINALIGNGELLGSMDSAQKNGMHPTDFSKKMVAAMETKKEEVYIGGKETLGVFIKRFFPALFSRIIRKMKVT